MNKLKSYTIIELLISMMVISIIVYISYSFFSLFTKQFDFFRNTEDTFLEFSFFKKTLQNDFFQAKQIEATNNNIQLVFHDKKVEYSIKEDLVYRIEKSIDSFSVNISNVKTLYKNKDINLVTDLILEAELYNTKTTIFMSKSYGVDILVNNYFNDEN